MKTIKIDGVELTEDQIRKAYEELEEKKKFPKEGDMYWFTTTSSFEVSDSIWDDQKLDFKRKRVGNIYKTKKEAEKAKLRMECSARRWEFVPKNGDNYFTIGPDGFIISCYWHGTRHELIKWQNGLIYPDTEEGIAQCKEHWEKYKNAFDLPK